jgi:hypothetical protein
LLKKRPASAVHRCDHSGATPLHVAVEQLDLGAVRLLVCVGLFSVCVCDLTPRQVRAGADALAPFGVRATTPLHELVCISSSTPSAATATSSSVVSALRRAESPQTPRRESAGAASSAPTDTTLFELLDEMLGVDASAGLPPMPSQDAPAHTHTHIVTVAASAAATSRASARVAFVDVRNAQVEWNCVCMRAHVAFVANNRKRRRSCARRCVRDLVRVPIW